METIVIFMNRIFDGFFAPFAKSPIYVDITIISAISALIFLVIFKKSSNQEKIQHYKNKIFALILEIRLYKDQPVLTFKNILWILSNNFIYLRYTLVPMIAIVPLLLIISVQINNRYGYLPIKQGKSFIIHAEIEKNFMTGIRNNPRKIQCNTSKGILVETPSMAVESEASIFWRAKIVGSDVGRQFCQIAIVKTDHTLKKEIFTTKTKERFSPKRSKWNPLCLLVNNAEDFIPETSPFKAVSISYDRATHPFIVWNVDPIVLYFILTLILGFLLKPIIKVNF